MNNRLLPVIVVFFGLGTSPLISQDLALVESQTNANRSPARVTDWTTPGGAIDPNMIFLRDASGRLAMPFTHPTLRAFSRPLAGVRYVIALDSEGAKFRTRSSVPEFDLILPPGVRPSDVLALVMFGENRDVERKVQTGDDQHPFPGRLMAFRTIPLDVRAASDQSGAPVGFIVYRVKPSAMLDPGEYGLLLAKEAGDANSAVSYGPNEGFNVYDFAVE